MRERAAIQTKMTDELYNRIPCHVHTTHHVYADDSLHSCNGESSSYYVGDDTWNTTYISNDGDELEVDVFYAANPNELWVRHLQVCDVRPHS